MCGRRLRLKRIFFAAFAFSLECFAFAGPEDTKLFFIKSLDISVDGRTTESAIRKAANFIIGEELRGQSALNEYIADKTRLLLNNRVFEEVNISDTFEEEAGGRTGVRLSVFIRDTRNFIILPEPKYGSGSGFEPAIKIRDYNFLGTMTPLKIDLKYSLDDFHLDNASKGKYSLLLESEFPFHINNIENVFKFALGFSYVTGERPVFQNISGLSVNIPIKHTRLSFGAEQGTYIGEEYYSFEKQFHNDIFENITYMTTMPFVRWDIPFNALTWTSGFATTFTYKLDGNELERRRGPQIMFTNRAGRSTINWSGNFRDGNAFYIEAGDGYNGAFNEWNNSVALKLQYHKNYASFAGISSNARYKIWFNKANHYRDTDRLESGNMLRGVLDRSIVADSMLSVNFDFPFRVLRFLPSEWFGVKFFRYFNFEMHVSPIFDMALLNGRLLSYSGLPIKDITYSFTDIILAGGAEILVFPLAWRSIFLRLSAGWSQGEREIYIGLGHHY